MKLKQLEDAIMLEHELRCIRNGLPAYKDQVVAQAAALLRELAAEPGWRPIETAPLDGTFVLLAGDSGYTSTPLRVEVCRWESHVGRAGGSWRNHAHDHFTDGGGEPTYWLPLPMVLTPF